MARKVMRGDMGWRRTVDAASYLHCIAADRTEHSPSRSGPSRCTWCTSRPDLDAAPGRPPLFSCPPSLGIGRDELKRPENSLRTHAQDRSRTCDRGATCIRGVPELLSVSSSKIDFDWFLGGRSDNIRCV